MIGGYNYGMVGVFVVYPLILNYRMGCWMIQKNGNGKFYCRALVWMQQIYMSFDEKHLAGD